LLAIESFLANPNIKSPVQKEAFHAYTCDPLLYEKTVKEFAEKHKPKI
jgi:ubiquitin-protein ligase